MRCGHTPPGPDTWEALPWSLIDFVHTHTSFLQISQARKLSVGEFGGRMGKESEFEPRSLVATPPPGSFCTETCCHHPGLPVYEACGRGQGLGLLPVTPLAQHPTGPRVSTLAYPRLSLGSPDPLQPRQRFPPSSGLDGSGHRLCWTQGGSSETQ